MTALLAMFFKIQFGLTAFFGLSFSMAMRNVQAADLEFQLEAQQLEVKPAEKIKPAPAKPEKKEEPKKK